jgi:hypothetical protein
VIARIVSTAILLLLAAGNFLGGVLMPAGPLNPLGIALLALAGVFWFGWEMILDAYAYQEERRRADRRIPDPLLVRFAPALGALPRGDELKRSPRRERTRSA